MPSFFLVGNALCLDFVNTEAVDDGRLVDLVPGFDALVTWSVAAETLTSAHGSRVRRRWSGTPEAGQTMDRARALRAVLRDLAERLAAGRPVPGATLEAINRAQQRFVVGTILTRAKGGYATRRERAIESPIELLAPMAESAADLLAHADVSLVRRCQNPACILYFLDTTKNHARRWCTMSGCGNRMKVAAYHRRQRNA